MTKKSFLYLSLIFSFSACFEEPRTIELKMPSSDAVAEDTAVVVEGQYSEDYDDCVFDTNTYKFTTEALMKYSPKLRYDWDLATESAKTRLANGDSLTLHIGGCTHFVYQAKLLTSIPFFDTTALLNETGWLAGTFFDGGFDKKIPALISRGQIQRISNSKDEFSKTYLFADPDTTVTNLILDGFVFEKRGNGTVIDLSAYIN